MRTVPGKTQGFTLVEVVIVISVLTILNGIGMIFLIRFFSVHDEVSARSRIVAENHIFLEYLREDTTAATRVLPRFRDATTSSRCLILETGAMGHVIVYEVEEGQTGLRREYDSAKGLLLSERVLLDAGQSVIFRLDAEQSRILWVEIERSSPSRQSERLDRQKSALYLSMNLEWMES